MEAWVISIVTGLLSGAVTGTATCWFFYRLSGQDLKREASDLRKLNVLIIRALENAGLVEINWDENHFPKGLVIRAEARTEINLSGSALQEIAHPQDNTESTEKPKEGN
jgi:hypothetical protein